MENDLQKLMDEFKESSVNNANIGQHLFLFPVLAATVGLWELLGKPELLRRLGNWEYHIAFRASEMKRRNIPVKYCDTENELAEHLARYAPADTLLLRPSGPTSAELLQPATNNPDTEPEQLLRASSSP